MPARRKLCLGNNLLPARHSCTALNHWTAERLAVQVRTRLGEAAFCGHSADEAAFHAIGSRGITALVRPESRPTCAEFWLEPPEEVLAFLRIWLASSAVGDAVEGGQLRR